MGLFLSLPQSSIDEGATGPPYNRYWRDRSTQDSWKLRESLLDGDIPKIKELLGLPEETRDRTLNVIEATPDANKSIHESRGCIARFMRCFARKQMQGNRSFRQPEAPSQPDPSPPLATFDVNSYKWFDDGDNTILHYLAIGRTTSNYSGVNLHVPALYGDRTQTALETILSRCFIISLLVKYGRINADVFSFRNSAGSSPLHIAVAHGELQIIRALLEHAGSASEAIRVQPDSSGLLPVDLALSRGHVRCARELGLLLLSNLDDLRMRSEAILALHDADRVTEDGDWALGLEIHEIQISIQSSDSQRITVIRERERELAKVLQIPQV